MITRDLARRLRDAGLEWTPGPGDRFIVPDRDMDDEVFIVSQMTIESYERPSGRVIRFNGTTEWALDTIEEGNVLWLPREDQLRSLLGDAFVRLESGPDGYVVVTRTDGGERTTLDADVETAYARSVLDHLLGETAGGPAPLRLAQVLAFRHRKTDA